MPRPSERGPELRSRISRPSAGLRLRKSFRVKMAMEMRLPVARKPLSDSLGRESKKHLVVPGDTITTDTGFMRYVGTWGLGGHRGGCRALHVACQPKPGPLSPCVKAPASPRAHLQSIPAVWFQRPRASTPCISCVPVCVCFGPLKRSSLGLWWP